MTPEQAELAVSLKASVECVRRALISDDFADCVDWLTTVQLRAAELSATMMTDIQNRPTA